VGVQDNKESVYASGPSASSSPWWARSNRRQSELELSWT